MVKGKTMTQEEKKEFYMSLEKDQLVKLLFDLESKVDKLLIDM